MNNYNHTIEIKSSTDMIYKALTEQIPLWWTETYEGSSLKTGDRFTIRFGDQVHKTMRVKECVPHSRVIWEVEDALIAISSLKNQSEWIGTTIVWEMKEEKNTALLDLTHIGLNPSIECYEICIGGWKQFIGSLKMFLETGKGNPYAK
ncbi:SRPBCC family protein [Chryseobacterium sp. Mn2064]|uniref:SRPBCC family protein n=1 Tax=Chryseobacterium sp. Mn2064 TaxID=3395263 RepID=UPI003BC564EA